MKVKYSPPQSDLDEIEKLVKKTMGNECKVVFDIVEDIPSSNSGKFRYMISELH